MKPNAIKILFICGDILGHALHLLVFRLRFTLPLPVQPRRTYVDFVARSFPILQTGMPEQST